MSSDRLYATSAATVLLAILPLVEAHDHDGMNMTHNAARTSSDGSNHAAKNYFRYDHNSGWMLAHIVLMVLG